MIVRLDTRPPFDVPRNLAWLAGRALPGVEHISGTRYRRAMRMGEREGELSVEVDERGAVLTLSPELRDCAELIVPRIRRLLDLDAQPDRVLAHLGQDPILGESVRQRPGLRVPGAFDPYELAVRAVLGQQVSVKSATTLAGRLVEQLGSSLRGSRLFPPPEVLARTPLDKLRSLGLPARRAETLRTLARAVAEGTVELGPGADPERAMAAMVALPGIGPWTASYVAMRGLGWPDAFPAEDLMIKRALGVSTAREASRRAEAWRPWRAYAVLHLWTAIPVTPSGAPTEASRPR
jgi:AraC family transcriptional regulator of adaptative response / DNA-3-methyladenine glycosylase II